MSITTIKSLPRRSRIKRFVEWWRVLMLTRQMRWITGLDVVVMQGKRYPLAPVPLGVAKELVPAIITCTKKFSNWEIDESLFDSIIKTIALGLRVTPREIEMLDVSLWDLPPVIERIASINGMPMMEANDKGLGELQALMRRLSGMQSTGKSSAPLAGVGST